MNIASLLAIPLFFILNIIKFFCPKSSNYIDIIYYFGYAIYLFLLFLKNLVKSLSDNDGNNNNNNNNSNNNNSNNNNLNENNNGPTNNGSPTNNGGPTNGGPTNGGPTIEVSGSSAITEVEDLSRYAKTTKVLGGLGTLTKGASKVLAKAGPVMAIGMAGYDMYKDWNDPNKSTVTKVGDIALDADKAVVVLAAGELGAAIGEAAGEAIGNAIGLALDVCTPPPIGEIVGPLLGTILGNIGGIVGGIVASDVAGFVMDEAKKLWDYVSSHPDEILDELHDAAHAVEDWTASVAKEAWHDIEHAGHVIIDAEGKAIKFVANCIEKGTKADCAKQTLEAAYKEVTCSSFSQQDCNGHPICSWCEIDNNCVNIATRDCDCVTDEIKCDFTPGCLWNGQCVNSADAVSGFAECHLNESNCKSDTAPHCDWCPSQNKCYLKTDFPCADCGITNSDDCPLTANCAFFEGNCMTITDKAGNWANCNLNESDCRSTEAIHCSWCPSQNRCYIKTDFPCADCGVTNSDDCPTTAGCMFCNGNCSSASIDGAECIGGEVEDFTDCNLNETDCKSATAPHCSWCPSQDKCFLKTDFPCADCGITNFSDCPLTGACGWCDSQKCLSAGDAALCNAKELKDAAEKKTCDAMRATHTCCDSDCDWDPRPKCC